MSIRALRLAEREQLRLPFAMERGWIAPVLRRDPELARAHRRLLGPGLIGPDLAPAGQATTAPVAPVIVEQLSEREREVLRYMSRMLTAAETASELYISINTVKSHLKNIYRKLQAPHCRAAVRRTRQLGLIGLPAITNEPFRNFRRLLLDRKRRHGTSIG